MKPDVIVAGGGPSGLAAAIGLATAGREVVIVEPKPGVIDKACGEGLMPGARQRLEALGVGPVPGKPFKGIRYRDAVDPERFSDGDFPGQPGMGVRRLALHGALHARAEALGVRWVEGRVKDVEQSADHVTAAGLTARYLIAADGLHSPIRRRLGLDAGPGRFKRYGVRQHFARAPWLDRVEVHWTSTAEAYVTPVADDRVGIAFLFRKPDRFERLMDDFPLLRERLGDAATTSAVRGAGPFHQRARTQAAGRVLLVGDASGYLDPLTGEGIALGLSTSEAAVRCIVDERPERYPRAWRKATFRYYALTAGLLGISRVAALRRLLIPITRRAPFVFDLALRLLGGEHRALPQPTVASGAPSA